MSQRTFVVGVGMTKFAPQSQRVPLIVSGPGLVPHGAERGDLAQGLDLARTILGLARVEATPVMGGRDLLAATPAPELVFSTIGFGERSSLAFPNEGSGRYVGDRGWPRRSCVRTDRWRLDRNMRIDGRPADEADWDIFFVDYAADPTETVNLADDVRFAAVRDDLLSALAWNADGAVETPESLVYPIPQPGLAP